MSSLMESFLQELHSTQQQSFKANKYLCFSIPWCPTFKSFSFFWLNQNQDFFPPQNKMVLCGSIFAVLLGNTAEEGEGCSRVPHFMCIRALGKQSWCYGYHNMYGTALTTLRVVARAGFPFWPPSSMSRSNNGPLAFPHSHRHTKLCRGRGMKHSEEKRVLVIKTDFEIL